jgi:hypothetical protein
MALYQWFAVISPILVLSLSFLIAFLVPPNGCDDGAKVGFQQLIMYQRLT